MESEEDMILITSKAAALVALGLPFLAEQSQAFVLRPASTATSPLTSSPSRLFADMQTNHVRDKIPVSHRDDL